MSVVFQDGEPVDPLKLRALQDQITAISKTANDAFNLGSTLSAQQRQVVFHTKAGVTSFEGGFTKGQVRNRVIDVEWGGEYTDVYTVATPRLQDPGKNNIRVSLSGNLRTPTVVVWSGDIFKATLNVHWISVAVKPVD